MKRFLISLALFCVVLSHIPVLEAAVPWKKYSFFSNWGGLNDNLSQLEIDDNEATDIQNVIFDNGGALVKRYGYQNIVGSSAASYKLGANVTGVPGIFYYQKSNGNKYLFAVGNNGGQATGYSKTIDASGAIPTGTWSNQGDGNLPSSFTDNQLVTFSVAQDILVMTVAGSSSNTTYPSAWEATGNVYQFTADADCPKAKYNAFHKNILFLAGDPSNLSRVSFSDLTGGVTNWIATDFFDLDKNNGQYITGLISAFGNLYIFQNNSIWMLSGSTRDDFSLQKMVDNVGTLSQQSISIVNNKIFFITSQNDVAIYDGAFGVQFISSKIRNTIGANNFGRAAQALGVGFSSYRYKDLDYYAAESTVGSSQNNQVLLFDTYRQAWTKLANMSPNSWTVIPSSSGLNQLVFGDYNGLVYFYPNIGTYSDPSNSCSGANACTTTSSSIYSFYQTKWFRFPEISLGDKYLRLLKTYVINSSTNSSTLQTEVKTDYASSGNIYIFNYSPSGALWEVSQWGDATWGGGGLNVDREEVNAGTQMFQIRYSNNTVDQDMSILGFELLIEPTDRI
jgi:hypothetical protein